jgi:hypothetical protein
MSFSASVCPNRGKEIAAARGAAPPAAANARNNPPRDCCG